MIAPESDAGKRAQSELKRIEQEERERQERERLERERQEQERLAREQQERERQEREQVEQAQAAAAQCRWKWGIPAAQTLNKFLSSAKDMVNEQKLPQVPKPTMPQVPKLKMPEPPKPQLLHNAFSGVKMLTVGILDSLDKPLTELFRIVAILYLVEKYGRAIAGIMLVIFFVVMFWFMGAM